MLLWQQALAYRPWYTDDRPWYTDSLLAFDSQLFTQASGGTLTEYAGHQLQYGNNVLGTGGNAPAVYTDNFMYGSGIRMRKGSWIATPIGSLANSIIGQPFTLDFWYRELEANTTNLSLLPIVCYSNIQVGGSATWNNRLLIGGGIAEAGNAPYANMEIWNNAQLPRVNGTFEHGLRSTTWQHAAITYDGTFVRLWRNGVLQGQMTWTIQQLTGNAQFGLGSFLNDIDSLIERYRLRSGVHFTSTFDPHSSY